MILSFFSLLLLLLVRFFNIPRCQFLVGWFFKKDLQKRLRMKPRYSAWMSLMLLCVEQRCLAS